jgi:hypothetical protein
MSSQLGRRLKSGESRLQVNTGKKLMRPGLTEKAGVVVCACWSSYFRKCKEEDKIAFCTGQGKKARPYLQNSQSKKD